MKGFFQRVLNIIRIRIEQIGVFILVNFLCAIQLSGTSYYTDSFRSIPGNKGLSQASVYCMLQDNKGFVWIGTKNGLDRFDGYEFLTYKYDKDNPNSLSNNEITCLENDHDRYLWIGTRSGGVNRLEYATGKIIRFNGLTYDDLVQSLVLDSLNNLWVGTSEGLLVFSLEKNNEENISIRNVSKEALFYDDQGRVIEPNRNNLVITSLLEVKKGSLLVGCKEGLFLYDIRKNNFYSVSNETIETSVFTSLKKDEEGNVWAGSYDGLLKIPSGALKGRNLEILWFNAISPSSRRLPVNRVEGVEIDHEGNIWAGTRGAGLFRITGEEVTAHYDSNGDGTGYIMDDLINSLMIDRTGVLWVGTESKGIAYTDLYSKSFQIIHPAKEGINRFDNSLVTALTGNDKRLWVGTAGNGIYVYEHHLGRLTRLYNIDPAMLLDQPSSNEIMSLLVDRDNILWIGTATNSLIAYDEVTGFKKYLVNGFVFSVYEDRDGRIWYGTWGQGLGFVDKNKGLVERYFGSVAQSLGLSSDKVLSFLQDSNGLLWVGTKGGGINVSLLENVINRRGEFVSYKNDPQNFNSLSYNDVYDIFEDQKGNIWIATGSGLNKVVSAGGRDIVESALQGTLSFKTYAEREGLSGGLVFFIEEDGHGNLWIGTNKGVSKFDPVRQSFFNYGINDGLPIGELHINASFKDKSSGVMYFGGCDGIACFHPDSLQANPFPPKVQITNIRVNNQLIYPGLKINGQVILDRFINYTDHFVLSYSNNEISFDFSALHYSNPGKHQYAYRLKGYNENWQVTSSENRRATYTNLHEGNYVFEVKATDFYGNWAAPVASVSFTVNPPLWRTWWAYGGYLILLVALLFSFRKYSLIGVKEKNKLIIESLEHKKDKEISEAKMKFFTNISHEIRTPLTLIYAPLQEIIKRKNITPELFEMLMVMFRNVKRLLNLVDQLLEFRKIDAGHSILKLSKFNLTEIARDHLAAFSTMALQKGIMVHFESKEDIFIVADPKMISTSIYNLLSNAFKFTPAGGEVILKMGKIGDSNDHNKHKIKISVCDSGPGIPEKDMSRVFERFNQGILEEQEYHGGSGIGLSIVKEFVELNHGTIHVYNRSEGGCCFEICLPEKVGEVLEKTNIDSKSSFDPFGTNHSTITKPKSFTFEKPKSSNSKINNGRDSRSIICLIEDDLELVSWLLTVLGEKYRVYAFHDGNEAQKKVPALMPDLIICDIMLPGISGLVLVNNFKVNIETSHIPVIMLTAKSREEDVIEGLKSGADSYLTKPFNLEILNAQIDSLLASRKAFREKFTGKLLVEPSEKVITPLDEKFLKRLMEVTEAKMADPKFDVSFLVQEMNMSHSIILKKVKTLTGLSLVEFIRSMRIKRAAQIFRQDKLSVSEVSFMVGFSDPKYFSKCFYKQFGKKPSDYIKEFHD